MAEVRLPGKNPPWPCVIRQYSDLTACEHEHCSHRWDTNEREGNLPPMCPYETAYEYERKQFRQALNRDNWRMLALRLFYWTLFAGLALAAALLMEGVRPW